MTWRGSAWARKLRTGSPGRKAVLMVLAEEADQWGWALIGQRDIASDADIGGDDESRVRQVRRHLNWLAEHGLITVHQGRSKGGQLLNLYLVHFPARPKDDMPETHPSLSGRYERVAVQLKPLELPQEEGVEIGKPPDNMSGGSGGPEAGETGEPPDNESGGPADSGVRPPGQKGPNHRTRESATETPVPRKDSGNRARATAPASDDGPPAAGSDGPSSAEGGAESENPTGWARRLWRDGQAELQDAIAEEAAALEARQAEARRLWNLARAELLLQLGEDQVAEIERLLEPYEAERQADGRVWLRVRTRLRHQALVGDPGSWQAIVEAEIGGVMMARQPEACVEPAEIASAYEACCRELFVKRWERPAPQGERGRSDDLREGTVVMAARDDVAALQADRLAGAAIARLFGCAVRFEVGQFVREAAERSSAAGKTEAAAE